MKLSVVVTVRNRPKFLRECVRSLVAQTYPKHGFEIVIVDDASDDDAATASSIRQLQREIAAPLIQAHHLGKRLGPGGARNVGNAESTGDVIVVADSDDFSLPKRLARIAAYFNAHAHVDVFYSSAYAVDRDLGNRKLHQASPYHVDVLEQHQLIWHPTMAYRRAITVHYPHDMADVDYGFLLKAKAKGLQFGCLDEPLVLYRSHPAQISQHNRELQQSLAQQKRAQGRR